jgi:hypothetical protein
MMRSLAAALAALVLAVGLAPGGAAGDGGAKSRIKIKRLEPSGAAGTVRSGAKRCEGDRKVRFFRLEGFISVKVQLTRTNSKGKWRIERDLEPGRYFAKVDGGGGCRYDNSKAERLR